MNEIIGGNAKTARSDLLDLVGSGRLKAIGLRILAAFAGVAAAAKLIHGHGQGAVRFRTERAERHRLSTETLYDGLERLDLVERNGGVRNGIKHIAQKNGALVLGQLFKRRVGVRAGRADVGVKPANDFGRTGVKFRAFAETVKSRIR